MISKRTVCLLVLGGSLLIGYAFGCGEGNGLPVLGHVASYWPLHPGDTWNYTVTHAGTTTTDAAQQVVGAMTILHAESVLPVQQSEDGTPTATLYMAVAPLGGWQIVETDSFSPVAGTNFFRTPLQIPDSLRPGVPSTQQTPCQGTGAGANASTATLTITLQRDTQTVTVPAGTFTGCIQVITMQKVLDSAGNPISYGHGSTRTLYLAPQFGAVKVTDDTGETLELTSATVNGTSIP
ncbi:MAG TPA: hypothetical protein VKU00_30685 [Chthonomonadaceae bacterium]|nr:hypothetical protein [Chthonomonadaceae bacterium]